MNDWLEQAACVGMDTEAVFVIDDKRRHRAGYTSPHTRAKLANALAVCHQCPVAAECYADMLTWDTPPRDIIIAALPPREATWAWHRAHGHTITRRTA